MSYGIKVSRQGYDAHTASDKQLAFSSEWPLLPIEAEGSKALTNSTAYDEVLFTHNLGYAPVFFIWQEYSGTFYPRGKYFGLNVYATTTTLHLEDTPLNGNCTLHWKVFRRPILKNYTGTNLITTDLTEGSSGDYGVLVSKPGESVNSSDKRNFSVRSDLRQFMVHQSGYETSDLNTSTYTHSLGYPPIYWLYVEQDLRNPAGAYSLISETDDFVVSASTTQLTWTFYAVHGLKFAYIIFKDPTTSSG
jgi:hypothetical protein